MMRWLRNKAREYRTILAKDAQARQRVLLTFAGCMMIWGGITGLVQRYSIAVDRQDTPCLPWSVFLVDHAVTRPVPGELRVFKSRNVPYYPDGKLFAKYVAGVEGDVFEVTASDTRVRGQHWGALNPNYIRSLRTSAAELTRTEVIPPRHVVMLTAAPSSYDSRYWGFVAQEQIVGKAIPLW